MKAYLEGLLYAVLLVAFFLIAMSMAGCAGVQMTDDERIACRSEICTPWTESELRALIDRAGSAGYRKGWADATKQAGRNL